MEPAGASLPRLGVVGELQQARRGDELRERTQAPSKPPREKAKPGTPAPDYAWTDLTYLLHKRHVSWRYYVVRGTEPDCASGEAICRRVHQDEETPGLMNPLPWFSTVRANRQLRQHRPDAIVLQRRAHGQAAGRLVGTAERCGQRAPAESGQPWPGMGDERRQRGHEEPELELERDLPRLGRLGRFLRPRCPADGRPKRLRPACAGVGHLAYARRGFVDHQVLSFDAYAKFIEDDFLGGQRLDPKTDGRPDQRPTVRENVPELGDLLRDFDFTRPPRPPLLLPLHPRVK